MNLEVIGPKNDKSLLQAAPDLNQFLYVAKFNFSWSNFYIAQQHG